MIEAGHCDAHPLIDALRQEGADQLDPVRFHYIAVLARHAGAHRGSVKRILDGKLEAAAATLRERLARARSSALNAGAPVATPQRETLADLVRHLDKHAAGAALDKPGNRVVAPVTPRTELKSVQYFRNTWSKLSAEKQVTQALGLAPQNAGPINSHVVALRVLALMRDTSPDYLNRFMSYADTLLCLDQSDKPLLPANKTPRAVKPKLKS